MVDSLIEERDSVAMSFYSFQNVSDCTTMTNHNHFQLLDDLRQFLLNFLFILVE